MALNGYRSADDKRSRLVSTSKGLVVAVQIRPQQYEIYKDGELIGDVRKFKNWFACTDPIRDAGGCGPDDAYKRRRDAIEALVSAQIR